MKIDVPWWLFPWPQARRTRQHILLNKAMMRELELQARWLRERDQRIDDLCETADQDIETIARLESELRKATGTVTGALSSQKPDWVLVGIPRPGRGVRVWASRELSGTAFDMTPLDEPPPRWQIKATMAQALTVDEPDYGAAMAKITVIWRNWDRAQEKTYRTDTDPIEIGEPRLTGTGTLTGGPGLRREIGPGSKERWKSNLPELPE